jgi:hypothetical protein
MATFRPEIKILGYVSIYWAFYLNSLLSIYVHVMHYFKTYIFKYMSSKSSSFHTNQAVTKTAFPTSSSVQASFWFSL